MSPGAAPVGRKVLAISATAHIRLPRLRLAHCRVDAMPCGIVQSRFPCREPQLNLRPSVSGRCPAHQRVDLPTSLVHELKHPVPGSSGAGRHGGLCRAVDKRGHCETLSTIAGAGSRAMHIAERYIFPHCIVRSWHGLLPRPNLCLAGIREFLECSPARNVVRKRQFRSLHDQPFCPQPDGRRQGDMPGRRAHRNAQGTCGP